MEARKGTFRYQMLHLGDIFVAKMAKGFRLFGKSSRGVVVTYDLRELKRKRKKVLLHIGTRMADLKTVSPELDIFQDNDLSGLFNRLERIEQKIELRIQEREERLYPGRFQSEPLAAAA
ncbi:MAG: hypothetical protein HQK75_16105 [Candidatus Magnetomorum sp.]|nr:hypothetical protein [Candidatus Magnetomorum sp.]